MFLLCSRQVKIEIHMKGASPLLCEQLISHAWRKMIDEICDPAAGGERMPKDRRSKLNGRDYAASVKVEMLEMNGRIDNDLYRMLQIARKARNQ